MDETALKQAIATINLGLSVLTYQVNHELQEIKAKDEEIASLKLEVEKGKKAFCELAKSAECEIEKATRQAGQRFTGEVTPPQFAIPPKIDEPVYTEAKP